MAEIILVTGKHGNLGQDLIAYLQRTRSDTIIGTASDELDLAWDTVALHQTLDRLNPSIIINTAAFTHVDAAETEMTRATQVNSAGPEALALWVQRHGRYMIHISTDYVFDGTKGSPYTTQDSPNPCNQYGHSKWLGEQALIQHAPDHAAVVRTSWLYGSGAKNFVPFVIQSAREQKPVRIVADQWGTPTWTGDLCPMLNELCNSRQKGLLHGCNVGSVTRLEQAYFIHKQLELPIDTITPITTTDLGLPAPRPINTSMTSSFNAARHWEEAMVEFLQQQGSLTPYV